MLALTDELKRVLDSEAVRDLPDLLVHLPKQQLTTHAAAAVPATVTHERPKRTRTVMGSDYVIVFLEDVYTPVERTLIDAGRFETVRETRNAFQDTMREKFSAAVEEAVGRKVIGFLSQVHIIPDLSIETFILEPDGAGGPAEGEA